MNRTWAGRCATWSTLACLGLLGCGPSLPGDIGDTDTGSDSTSSSEPGGADGMSGADGGADGQTPVDLPSDEARCDTAHAWRLGCFPETIEGYRVPTDCGCCPMELSCPPVELSCESEDGRYFCDWWREGIVQNESEARCALRALRDGQHGLLQIHGAKNEGGGSRNLWVADRDTIVVLELERDVGGGSESNYVASAKPAAWFDACLDQFDRRILTECLLEGLLGRGHEAIIACPG